MEPLQVDLVEFYPKENSTENYTKEYDLVNSVESPTPIFRRGCNFIFAVRFDREFDARLDVIRVGFGFGSKPNVTNGTRAILPVLVNQPYLPENTNRWGLCISNAEGNTLTLQVHIPPNAQVGIWKCSIQTNISGKRDKRNDYKADDDIYILFNPWCRDDGVFMESEDQKKEYILNENGKIWCGTFKNPTGQRWIFGQFDDIVLPAAVFLLQKSNLADTDRGSPVLVTRAISAVINSHDDAGLLEGRWDGQYEDGTSPFAWTGSTAIMEEFFGSGGVPVKYAQCWVYSAAVVTVCRTLGIPCRSVTNYVSAHDTNCTLTVDKYFDADGNRIENGPYGDCNDSCWNFHVWNDVWMARPMLGLGYGGWQIIDATPQEKSGNTFQCGPASVEAVRKGEVGLLHDTAFVFSEVNADIVHFQADPNSDWGFSRLSVNQYHVGRKIVTKRIDITDDKGDSDMEIVTSVYKNLEGTEAERLAVYNAVKGVPNAQQYYDILSDVPEDVSFDLIDIDTVPFGENFSVVVKIQNNSNETRNISAMLSASSVYYTGSSGTTIKRSQGTFAVKAGENETLRIKLTPNEYLPKLVEHSLIKIYAIGHVQETKQTWSEEDDFTLTKPEMLIEVSGLCRVGQDCEVNFSFKNPLDMPLSQCSYVVESPGWEKAKVVPFRDVQPNEVVSLSEIFRAKRVGERQIVVNFNSKEIQGIGGSTKIIIE